MLIGRDEEASRDDGEKPVAHVVFEIEALLVFALDHVHAFLGKGGTGKGEVG